MGAGATGKLRALLADEAVLPVLGLPNARTAQLMERCGIKAGFVGTGITYGTYTGLPDTGVASSNECTMIGGWISRAVSFPVILDGDTGHGGPPAVKHFIRTAIREGLSGVRLDDQPIEYKRGTQSAGIRITSVDEAIERYRAATEVRDELDPDFIIMAQCYARDADNGGMDELLNRLSLYENEAGVDWVQFESPHSVEEVVTARERVIGPLSVMQGKMPRVLTLAEHQTLGLNAAWWTGVPGHIQMLASEAFLKRFAEEDITAVQSMRSLLES